MTLAESTYFHLCLVLGRLLRAARYSKAAIVRQSGDPSSSGSSGALSRDNLQVRKHRLFYAPPLIWIGGVLMKILDTGVRILPQQDWEQRERRFYWSLHGTSVRFYDDGVLVLPFLAGDALAALLDDPLLEESKRTKAIELAVVALAAFHRLGFTHGDAMAENVLVDLERGVAHWFDFETTHDPSRTMLWRRADDVRALFMTCLVRTEPDKRAEILRLILDAYGDEQVTGLLAVSFSSVFRRALTFHLAQAGLSFQCFREIGRSLGERFITETRCSKAVRKQYLR